MRRSLRRWRRATDVRIAIVLPGLGRVQRGAETAFAELARYWVRTPGVRVDAFGTGGDLPTGVTAHVLRCISRERFERWPHLPALRSEYEYEELTFALSLWWSRALKPDRYDVTIGCSYPYVNWLMQRARRRGRGPKLVFVTQNGDWMVRERRREYRCFDCDGLVCTNPEYDQRHRQRFPCALIPNGVDPEVFRPGDPDSVDSRIPPGKPVVLIASALIPSKGVLDGIHAVAAIPDVFLLVVGDGPQRAEIAEVATREIPGRHRLLGSVPRSRMPELYRRADVFLHLSRDEPFGIVYLEAAATGLPIVCHDSPTTRWILGESAIFTDTRDHAAIAQGLRDALGPSAKHDLGRAARARVLDGWTWETQADKYLAFMRQVCQGTVPRGAGSSP